MIKTVSGRKNKGPGRKGGTSAKCRIVHQEPTAERECASHAPQLIRSYNQKSGDCPPPFEPEKEKNFRETWRWGVITAKPLRLTDGGKGEDDYNQNTITENPGNCRGARDGPSGQKLKDREGGENARHLKSAGPH